MDMNTNKDFNNENNNQNINTNYGNVNINQDINTNSANNSITQNTNTIIDNYNNTNFNTSSNKKNLIIIAIIVLVIISILLFMFFSKKGLFNDKNNKSNNNYENNEVIKGADIIQISINDEYILMLDKKGDLYLYGEDISGLKSYENPSKIASNVKYFDDDGRIVIVDNNDSAYYVGLDIDGWGSTKEFELVTNNIKNITSSPFCFFIIDKDNNYIVRAPLENKNSKSFCALPEEFDGNFSKIASNVKDIYNNHLGLNGYLTNDNDLYVSHKYSVGYNKVLSNVNKIVGDNVITNEGDLYYLDPYNDQKVINPVKISDNIIDAYRAGNVYIYKTNNNEFYYTSMYKLDFDDIKIPYYYSNNKLIYLNNNNKLILSGEVDKYELKLSTDSMKQIYDFVK